jgi:DNA polymerase I
VYTAQPNAISLSKTVRAAMPPGPGKIYVHVDYRAAEWRLAAIMAGERKILDALDSGADPHKLTYSEMTGTPLDQVTSDQRDVGKVLNYAALFGSTGYSLARSLKCSESEASQKSKDFWSAYPALARWRDERHQYAKQHAKTLTILGRVRKLPEIFYNNKADHAKALRRSVNTSTQGSCGDVLKLAIRNFYIQADSPNTPLGRLGARIVCPVFDAALVEIVLPSELKEGTEDFETWKSMMETELRKVFEIPLQYRGVSSKMLVDMHWSTVSWLHAMGKS